MNYAAIAEAVMQASPDRLTADLVQLLGTLAGSEEAAPGDVRKARRQVREWADEQMGV